MPLDTVSSTLIHFFQSTLLLAILRCVRNNIDDENDNSGTVTLSGRSVASVPLSRLRQAITIIPQSVSIPQFSQSCMRSDELFAARAVRWDHRGEYRPFRKIHRGRATDSPLQGPRAQREGRRCTQTSSAAQQDDRFPRLEHLRGRAPGRRARARNRAE